MLFAYSSKPEHEVKSLRDRLTTLDTNWNEFAELEYFRIVEDLQNSQLDLISNGFSYNQTEIRKHLKKLR